ncbi:hypothetical protein P9222_19795 [Paenibacillus amylolyticus]|nr:hypothetical protein [Paenibacillus amylolyticus]WFR60783.1 hypothetical protein P9222_19795 [Paenibacillus amylolyticus]
MGNQATHVLAADYGASSGRVVRVLLMEAGFRYKKCIDSTTNPCSWGMDCIGISCAFFMN